MPAGTLLAGLLIAFCALPAVAGEEARPVERVGRLVRIALPVTGQTYEQVRRFVVKTLREAELSGDYPVLIFEFDVPPNQAEFARTSKFGAAHDLADFLASKDVNEVTTVAYIGESTRVQGHAVLVVLACQQIVMAPDAEIGPAGDSESTITPAMYSGYEEIAGRRKTIPAEVAKGLLDPSRKVLRVQTDVPGEIYVVEEALDALSEKRTIVSSEPVFQAAGRLSGEEARELGFVALLASDRNDLAKGLDLQPGGLEEDPSLGEPWRAVRVDLKGPINAEAVDRVQNMISDATRRDGKNFVCLVIDSPGGSPTDSIRLAYFLAEDLDSREVRTVAYIESEALADAAIVALACDQLVMHPRAVLGGVGDHVFSEEEILLASEALAEISPQKSRSWSLPVAMIDRDLKVFRYERADRPEYSEYFSEAELAEQPDSDQWEQAERITRDGRAFQARGEDAEDYWLAAHLARDFHEFKAHYGLEDDPALLEPGWADFLVDALATPGMAVLLLILGGVALYAEMHAPGMGIGGFIAAVCFVVFFWSRYLGGTAGWLEVTLFLAGLSCLMLEVFVLPGFGIFGLGGGMLVIISLILASQTFIWPRNDYQFARLQTSLLVLGGAVVGSMAAAMILNRWLPQMPLFGQMMLAPPAGEEAERRSRREALVDFDDLMGTRGTTLTPLVPSGKARFGNERLDVLTDGEFIQPGAEVEVVEVHGNRIVVRAADEVA